MTIRRWMILVAVVGLLMGGIAYAARLVQLRNYYRWRAANLRVAEKYECAARYPWLPVEPDPPDPE